MRRSGLGCVQKERFQQCEVTMMEKSVYKKKPGEDRLWRRNNLWRDTVETL